MKMLYHSLDLKFADDDPRNKDAVIMGEKMDHLNRIVEQILNFARSTEPRLIEVDIDELINGLGLLTRHKLKNHNIELVRKQARNLPVVMGDPVQLEQAFLNLMLNAVQAMPNGGRLSVTTRVVPAQKGITAPGEVVVEFKDTGEGMSDEQRRRAFTSLLSTTKREGTGLGLALVRRIVETHRGRVKISSRPGKGTTMTLVLPIWRLC
jgi:signal transduction histidine kinase